MLRLLTEALVVATALLALSAPSWAGPACTNGASVADCKAAQPGGVAGPTNPDGLGKVSPASTSGATGGFTSGVADPIVQAVKNATSPSATPAANQKKGGSSIAGQVASAAAKITSSTGDSQSDVMTTSQNLNHVSSGGSRLAGTLDTLEGLLLLPLHPWDAGKFLFSGQQAHKASDQLENNSRLSAEHGAHMTGMQELIGSATSGTPAGSEPAGTVNGSSSSRAMAADDGSSGNAGNAGTASNTASGTDRAQDLFQQLETSYGVNRDDFVAAVNETKANPGDIGEFMQEKTGNPKLGREAAMAAVESYMASAFPSGGTYTAAAVPERSPASATLPANVIATDASKLTTLLPPGSESGELSAKAAKRAEEEKSLRDRLKKSMADRQSAGPAPGTLADSAESLQPLREGLFQQAADAQDDGQSLFDVVHVKYVSLTNRMRPKTAVLSH